MKEKTRILAFTVTLLALAGAVLSWALPGQSAALTFGDAGLEEEQREGELPPPSTAYCLLCHSEADRVWVLPSGETLSLTIDPAVLGESVHTSLACADCHTDHRFPHPPPASQTVREFRLERYPTCRTCHEDQYTHLQDSVHGQALRAGQQEAAICIDCHDAHDVQPPGEPRPLISVTCAQCHGAIFEEYRTSVHGAALLEESNPDVPTCIDCHGVHDIENPTTTLFRVRSPELCAGCHANTELMAKYGISDQVYDTYLSDFHGTTVALFEQQDPNVATNKAVCYDCHGVHNILPADNENSQVVRENLLTTCRKCHPDATANFPDSWVGHRPATLEDEPFLFMVKTVYNMLIPATIGTFLFLIATDIFRRLRQRQGNHQGSGG